MIFEKPNPDGGLGTFLQDYIVNGRDVIGRRDARRGGAGGESWESSPGSLDDFLQHRFEAGRDRIRPGALASGGDSGGDDDNGPPGWPGDPWPPDVPCPEGPPCADSEWPPDWPWQWVSGATLSCRTRGGLASLCGYSEFGTASAPPKFFKRKSIEGTINIFQSTNDDCSEGGGSNSGSLTPPDYIDTEGGNNASGSIMWMPVSSTVVRITASVSCPIGVPSVQVALSPNNVGAVASQIMTNGGTWDIDLSNYSLVFPVQIYAQVGRNYFGYAWGPLAGPEVFATGLPAETHATVDSWDKVGDYGPNLPDSCAPDETDDSTRTTDGVSGPLPLGSPADYADDFVSRSGGSTTRTTSGNGECLASGGGNYSRYSGSVAETLTDEDTEDDAIVRLLTANDWGTWEQVGVPPCTSGADCCLSAWEIRTASTFTYQIAQWRLQMTGATPGKKYYAAVQILRREYGTTTWAWFQTIVVSGVADVFGNVEFTGEVPIQRGYESHATLLPP